ncbi:MAG TPA: trypsin-like peptidase domain-containing protein [Phycisphaerae bacterium]|nr:trypsin-like peptidase domain-containing protein [Phycisphaerae bacterium]HRY68699.1 trypsin-like peptidase domain-containing protein [Phycisphaerae bacterium]HSA25525.1 trypsin-like peptidase domain-containing protein [Phycisphaerae bacterium]
MGNGKSRKVVADRDVAFSRFSARRFPSHLILLPLVLLAFAFVHPPVSAEVSPVVRAAEQRRIETIARASRSAVCIFLDEGEAGSGVVICPDGYGLTNFHVIAGTLKTRRAFGGLSDGKQYPLEVLGIDPTGDMAMFRLTGKERFECAEFGDSEAVRVGDEVFAAGNPFMLAEDSTPTITAGIVSGVHRYQYGQDARSLVYADCIQVDASINPGNSGGPLFDAAGRLIGINGRASFERRGRVNVGLAYAISINQFKRFIPGLKAGLLVEHGSLGATAVDAGYRQVVFDRVMDRAAAAAAGIKPGDRLVGFADHKIRDANHFTSLLGSYPAGWPVSITWQHEGRLTSRVIELDPLTVRIPDELKGAYRVDVSVTRAAAESLSAAPASPSAPVEANVLAPAIESAIRSTVKLYGGRLGSAVGYGSGVIVSPQGDVLTTLSVLVEGSELRAVTHDGHAYPCLVICRDEYRQLALLRMRRKSENADTAAPLRDQMTPPRWEPLPMADPTAAQPGDWILAVGNPCKVADGAEAVSVTRGILSGRTRLDAVQGSEAFPYRGDVLLLDTVTSNPGSPGSAVVDLDGHWVGVVGEVVASQLTNTELSYAYPVEEIKAFLRDAAVDEAASRPRAAASRPVSRSAKPGYHGIRLSTIAYHRQLPFVKSVADGSPAKAAGVRADDLIISANRTAVPQGRVFTELCERLLPGEELSLIVKRGEELIPVRFVLTEDPE